MKIFVVTISDRASRGEYEYLSGPAIHQWLDRVIVSEFECRKIVIPDGVDSVKNTLVELCDKGEASLIFTTGGTGPAPRDVTPEAMNLVLEKELLGFGELMRRKSLEEVPTAILSRQTAGIRGNTLIVNLPGRPSSIRTCMDAVFPAIPFCLDLIEAPRIETDPEELVAFRPE